MIEIHFHITFLLDLVELQNGDFLAMIFGLRYDPSCYENWNSFHLVLGFQEQRAMLENETLRRQARDRNVLFILHLLKVEELRGFFPKTDHSVLTYLEYYATERKNSPTDNGSTNPPLAQNCSIEKDDSDTTLHLGFAIFSYIIHPLAGWQQAAAYCFLRI
ncbi:hypothetical protein SADUNF_Sadunf16G0148400 [Salix dunnii]|uniref:Uncharacterized protein n=1 Tax=Salix dunnii TaxID=1413687 RepID=A0A835JED5_9ROSI|nr:hypothetical protein SADUNF_Sadunf16G0148400 [Salix dunnii]